jgi:hypothetical protein
MKNIRPLHSDADHAWALAQVERDALTDDYDLVRELA